MPVAHATDIHSPKRTQALAGDSGQHPGHAHARPARVCIETPLTSQEIESKIEPDSVRPPDGSIRTFLREGRVLRIQRNEFDRIGQQHIHQLVGTREIEGMSEIVGPDEFQRSRVSRCSPRYGRKSLG